MSWVVEYESGGSWYGFIAEVESITEELSAHQEAFIRIPNTSANRSLVANDLDVHILYNGGTVFTGLLTGVEYSPEELKCTLYNEIYEKLKKRVITGSYSATSAADILNDICDEAGVTAGECPSTTVSLRFSYTDCYEAAKLLAEACTAERWAQDNALNIGTKGYATSIGTITESCIVSNRGIDRSKQRDKVIVKGMTTDGEVIFGEAGSGDDVAVFTESKGLDADTLDAIAAAKLAELNTDNSGVGLKVPTSVSYNINSGDTLTINTPDLNLNGDFRVKKITKGALETTIEIDRKKNTLEAVLDSLKAPSEICVVDAQVAGISYGSGIADMLKPALVSGATIKGTYPLTVDYLKESCILGGNVVLAGPTGNMNSYEAGYVCLALISEGETSLAEDILDLWVTQQNASDGSWYQQYNPYKAAGTAGTYAPATYSAPGQSGDLKVDSGAALLAWAMAQYDIVTAGTRYQSCVQAAMSFLRDLQYAHSLAHSSGLLANLIYTGTTDTVAFAADSAECLIAMEMTLRAYGDINTSDGYSVKTMANDVYYSLATSSYGGTAAHYYRTTFPVGSMTLIPFTYKEKISYTQALCTLANKMFGGGSWRTTGDYTSQCEDCLDFILPLTSGQWGGQMYSPYYADEEETQNEYAGYTGLMAMAMGTVNSSKYANEIARSIYFLRWIALPDGKLFDFADKDGRLWVAQVGGAYEGYGFLSLSAAQGILAGA